MKFVTVKYPIELIPLEKEKRDEFNEWLSKIEEELNKHIEDRLTDLILFGKAITKDGKRVDPWEIFE